MFITKEWRDKGKFYTGPSAPHAIFYVDLINEDATNNDTLTILHGFPESSFSFHKVIDELSRLFKRIVLPDFIGFGFSDKPASGYSYSICDHANVITDLLSYLEIADSHLLCHDMGDTVGTELLSRQIDDRLNKDFLGFKSVIFTNGSMAIEHASLRVTQRILLGPFGFILSRLSSKRLFTHQVRSAHGNGHVSMSDIDDLWDQLNVNKGRHILHLLIRYYKDRIKYESSRYLPVLSKLEIPIFFCWGRDDQVARLPIPYDIQKRYCPSAKVVEVDGMGHFGQLGEPKVWAMHVSEIYKTLI